MYSWHQGPVEPSATATLSMQSVSLHLVPLDARNPHRLPPMAQGLLPLPIPQLPPSHKDRPVAPSVGPSPVPACNSAPKPQRPRPGSTDSINSSPLGPHFLHTPGIKASATPDDDVADAAAVAAGIGAEWSTHAGWEGREEAPEGCVIMIPCAREAPLAGDRRHCM